MSRDRAGRPADTNGRFAVGGLILAAVVAFAVVGVGAFTVGHRIARANALAEGLRTAHGIGRGVVTANLPGVLAGNPTAVAALDSAVASGREDGTLVLVKVWRPDGTVVWSDDHSLIGRRFPLSDKVEAVLARGTDYADISSLTGPERVEERGHYAHLLGAYIPLTVAGQSFALEMYFPGDRERQTEARLSGQLVLFALLALLALALAQLPVSIWLVRRVAVARQERERLLDTVLVTSQRERRLLAQDLHDGVVQELAGAAYLLDASTPFGPVPARARHAMGLVKQTLQQAVDELRNMMVELHPRDLRSDNLAELIVSSAIRACPDQQVTVNAEMTTPVTAEIAAFLHRCARECAINVAKHAAAGRVDVTLSSDQTGVRLEIQDDGVGISDTAYDRGDGHLGLVLLREAATDLGGSLRLCGDETGTLVTIELPLRRGENWTPRAA